jgi:hypothetical protein
MDLEMRRFVAAAVAAILVNLARAAPASALELNAGKYGATFYWWFERLPPTTLVPPTVRWDARDPAWWEAIVVQARDAGLGWLTPVCWGEGSNADPATLAPLMAAIDRKAPQLKVALFDDTTSEVLRKNLTKGRGWTLDVRFDLADLDGTGEGGLAYFYEQQWKRYFQTVPPRYRLAVEGRPVVFMWHGGYVWYARQNFFHALIDALRRATLRDFGVDPYVIVEESWLQLDPATRVEGLYDWFEAPRTFASAMTFNGVRVGHVVPGYDCSLCNPPGPTITRQGGELYQAGLQAVAADSDLVLIEGINNVDENAHLVETSTWGRLYLAITRWFATNLP